MTPAELRAALREFALSLPEAYEEHPWGESAVKVRKKVFVFFGADGSERVGCTLKLPMSQPLALAQLGVEPAGYGLGKSGWVDVRFDDGMAYEMLREWIDESYRAVAPKKLSAELGRLHGH